MRDLRGDFESFDAANPRVYELLVHFADMAIKAGRKRYSINALFERVRWHVQIDTVGSEWKLNNNHRAFYARKWIEDHPGHADFFETRCQKASI